MTVDEAFVSAYTELDLPADQLVVCPDKLARLIGLVESKTIDPFDREHAGTYLLNLRKGGRLPKLRRKPR